MSLDYSGEYRAMVEAYERAGGDADSLLNGNFASLVVHRNKVLSSNEIEGISIESKETERGVTAKIRVRRGYEIENPVHLCFGVLSEKGIQEIASEFIVEDEASVRILAHCSFPNAIRVRHLMSATVSVGRNASLSYEEAHYHGDGGGIEVIPKTIATIGSGGKFTGAFSLVRGRVGLLDLDYKVSVSDGGTAELVSKVYGKGEDRIKIKETVSLNGEGARSLIKSRVVVRDRAEGEIVGITDGNAPNSRGHVDCVEIVEGTAVAKALPVVSVRDPRAKVTHEAAIGSIDKKQVETLMARGLSEAEAVDTVVRGMLK